MPTVVRFEQAIYGSFPFRDRGYAPLAASAGCLPSCLDAFHAACRAVGEKPANSGDLDGMMFCLRVDGKGPWMIVGVSSPGSDDRGRPGALAFHGLFVEGFEFRKVGYDPFALIAALRSDWNATTTLAPGSLAVSPISIDAGARSLAISSALARGRKVAMVSESPIRDLARQVWRKLPIGLRKRRSVATWAFTNGPRFDLVAAPNLVGWDLDGAYRDPFGEETSALARKWRAVSWLQLAIVSTIVVLLAVVATVPIWWREPGPPVVIPVSTASGGDPLDHVVSYSTPHPPLRDRDPTPGPRRDIYPDNPPDAAEVPAVVTRLEALAKTQLAVPDYILDAGSDQPRLSVLMTTIGNYRYTGPLLNDEELAAIGRESGAGRSRALGEDRLIRRFLADRWPIWLHFRDMVDAPDRAVLSQIQTFDPVMGPMQTLVIKPGPLRWQVDVLAWSFHVDPDPKLTTIEAVDSLAEALKLDEPIASNPLALKYPTLLEYAKFLKRLPVR